MRVRDKGPIPWLFWALLGWRGKIKRLPYAVAFGILFLLTPLYQIAVVPMVAEYLYPPPGGAAISLEYVKQLASSPQILPFLIPLLYMYSVLDFKRLRSIEGPIVIGVLFAALSMAGPIYLPKYAEMMSLSVFAYHAILAVLPAKEDRISPYERKYRVWQSLAGEAGEPIRLPGKAIRHWHIVKQPKAKQ